MNREDRHLLGRVVKANQGIAECVNRLMGYLEADWLPADPLRELAERLDILAADLRNRADTIVGTPDD